MFDLRGGNRREPNPGADPMRETLRFLSLGSDPYWLADARLITPRGITDGAVRIADGNESAVGEALLSVRRAMAAKDAERARRAKFRADETRDDGLLAYAKESPPCST